MHQIDEIKEYLRKLKSGEFPHRSATTHLFELLCLMKSGVGEFCETEDTHYEHDSLTSEILFADGKKYRIEITEVKEKK